MPLKLCLLSPEFLILSSQLLYIRVRGRAQALFDEVNRVPWLFGLLVETDEDLGELIDDSGLLEVRPELVLLLLCRCLLYTSPSPRDATLSRMPSSA